MKRKRRIQQCIFCQNHKLTIAKKNHHCPYKICDCVLCSLLKEAQETMRKQQRFWRHQRNTLRINESAEQDVPQGHVCDSCRNHEKIVTKKSHDCPYKDCSCELCCLTRKRREVMKQLQRVKRCGVSKDARNNELSKKHTEKEESPEKETEKSSEISGSNLKNSEEFVQTSRLCPQISSPSEKANEEEGIEEPLPLEFSGRSSPPPLIPLEECDFEPPEYYVKIYRSCTPDHLSDNSCLSPPPLCPIEDEDEEDLYISPSYHLNEDSMSVQSHEFDVESRTPVYYCCSDSCNVTCGHLSHQYFCRDESSTEHDFIQKDIQILYPRMNIMYYGMNNDNN